jgi:murein DD-endopeptidase MepM/ murein hydrolase activator NlpD
MSSALDGRLAAVGVVLLALAATTRPAASPVISLKARSFRPGELVIISVTVPRETRSISVTAFERDVPARELEAGRWQALAGIDLDRSPGEYEVSVRSDTGEARSPVQVTPRTFPVRKLTVNPDFVNPPAALAKRIAEESKLIERAYENASVETLWHSPFVRPVPHRANSRFGTRSIFNGEPRNPHGGTDFLSPAGTPVRAPGDGRIVIARDLFFPGRTVVIDHGGGLFSQLAHLSRIDVGEGEMVTAGDVIGLVGATGRVTGAHLHWAVRVSGARVDALSLLALLGAPAGQ